MRWENPPAEVRDAVARRTGRVTASETVVVAVYGVWLYNARRGKPRGLEDVARRWARHRVG